MKKKSVGYMAYGILITIVFLYCCFPDSCIKNFLESTASKNNPNIVVSSDSATLVFPLAVKIDNLVINVKDTPGATVRIDRIKARLALGKLLQGRISLSLKAGAYGGDVLADILCANYFSTSGPVKSQIRLVNVDIGECSYLKTILNRHITGRLNGSVEYSGKIGEVINGIGNADLVLRDGNMELVENLFGLDKLDFDTVKIDTTLGGRTLKIDKTDISGKQLSGSFNGNIFLNNNILRSRIAIKGRVHTPVSDKDLSVVLSGTLANPKHRISQEQ
ncbi:MAG: type II secretion system protein GspN [Syntrophales bacterium]|nr:type II secretion system protein GspN [Syntrophales bacterium]